MTFVHSETLLEAYKSLSALERPAGLQLKGTWKDGQAVWRFNGAVIATDPFIQHLIRDAIEDVLLRDGYTLTFDEYNYVWFGWSIITRDKNRFVAGLMALKKRP